MKAPIFLLFFSLLFVLSCKDSAPEGGEITEAVGTVAPPFTYTSVGGELFSLSELRGKVVYLFFYGANCPHCRSNGPVTESIHQQFISNSDFVALGLDTWNLNSSANISFREATGITYPLLLNARQSLVDYYGNAGAYDRSVVIDAEGKIAYQGAGYVNTDDDRVREVIQEQLELITE